MKLIESIVYSKIGYDLGKKKQALLRSDGNRIPLNFFLGIYISASKKIRKVYSGIPILFGEKWGSTWYQLNFTELNKPGAYFIECEFEDGTSIRSDEDKPIDIGENLLWYRTWYAVSLGQLEVRAETCYQPEGGWRDCGSSLQEVSSHLLMLQSLCDLFKSSLLPEQERKKVYYHLIRGCNYVCLCQKKAEELSLGIGCVVHEIRENQSISSGNCIRTAVILARVGKLIMDMDRVSACYYIKCAKRAYYWIISNGPIHYMDETDCLIHTLGAPKGFHNPPNQFMTRDLLSLVEASLELYEFEKQYSYLKNAEQFVNKVIARQVKKDEAEGGLYGHFHTYEGYMFTEKADLHCGAWNLPYKNYNQGSHLPYWILPLIRFAKIQPETVVGKRCDLAIREFTYHFLLPAMGESPFGIIPAGYYKEEGLVFFSGWYHGHNKIYGFGCELCMELARYLNDKKLIDAATDNLQWLSGCNSGINEGGRYISKSFVVGIGSAYHKDWNHLMGTVINGFDASPQFSVHEVKKDEDLPTYLDDEGGIHHSSGYLSGLCSYVVSA